MAGFRPIPLTSRTSQAAGDGRLPARLLRRSPFLPPPPQPPTRGPGAAGARCIGIRRVHNSRSPQPRAPSPTARLSRVPAPRRAPAPRGKECGRPPHARGPRRPPPRRAALLRPRLAQSRPGNKAGGARGGPRRLAGGETGARAPPSVAGPGDDSPQARPPACGARSGCSERRCWALRTGLAAPPPPLVANADLKPGESRGSQSPPPPPRARRPGPRGVFMCHIQAGGTKIPPSPEDGEGQEASTARARPQ